MSTRTPLMSQYRDIKSQYSDCILLFRVGDFYETFYDDALDVSSILNIALTTRDKNRANPVPLAGVPFHAAETYVTRLLSAGRKVAICEQVEDPAQARGLVRREVTEVLTPGTALSTRLLQEAENNYCLSLYVDPSEPERAGLAVIDVSTGEFACGESDTAGIEDLVQGRRIAEVIVPEWLERRLIEPFLETVGHPAVYRLSAEEFSREAGSDALLEQFGPDAGAGKLGSAETVAAGALLRHCRQMRSGALPQVVDVARLGERSFLGLDPETIGNLELFRAQRGASEKATLIRTLDRTLTPMGRRMLRRWMQEPLADVRAIERRLDAVEHLHGDASRLEEVARALKGVSDVERLLARIASRKAIPRELHALRESLKKLPALRESLQGSGIELFESALDAMGDHTQLCREIETAVVPDPPGHLRDGGVILRGCDQALDGLIDESNEAKDWIASLERRERASTGIASLRVGYNKVFGYYIEVSKANEASVPGHYVQKQTLVSAQRYYTQELKEKEDLILETEQRRIENEQRVFESLCERIARQAAAIQRAAGSIAIVDVVHSLAATARLFGYRRPVVDDSHVLEFVGGRHPVIERFIDEPFVPNDIHLDPARKQFGLITGPNMSGKSTFLRQTALMVVMAQMGSFVPADRARIGLVDHVFTRVGASDRLSRGESTFLVEMNETANILENMTDRSLVILDEIGRGTSTFDGLSIAWATTEYILEGSKARPRTLFATHFHELTQLRARYPRLVNLKITIREWEGGIVFLRKIVPGTSDRSFGIHAARVAGLPPAVLERAAAILHSLEERRERLADSVALEPGARQYGLFERGARPGGAAEPDAAPPSGDPIRKALADFDPESSTPLEAFDLLRRLKKDL